VTQFTEKIINIYDTKYVCYQNMFNNLMTIIWCLQILVTWDKSKSIFFLDGGSTNDDLLIALTFTA